MHSIVTMMEKVRAKPGSFGLVTANGWFLTKHACGVYSTTPSKGQWRREDPKSYQKEIDALPRPKVVVEVQGEGKVETYTAVTDRQGRRFGIIIGRSGNGDRFLANVNDETLVNRMMSEEMLDRPINVTHNDGKNTATF
jgi:acetyl-CoA C-acetyltransferase